MNPLTHYTIAIVYQWQAPAPFAYRPLARWFWMPNRLLTGIRRKVAAITLDHQPTLIEYCQEQE